MNKNQLLISTKTHTTVIENKIAIVGLGNISIKHIKAIEKKFYGRF